MGVLTDRIKNKLERSNLIDEHALNREPVPLSDEQISPPSLVCKQNSSHAHYLCVGILFNWIALGIGQLHDDVILLQLPESSSLLFSCAN